MRVLKGKEFRSFEQLVSLTQEELHACMATYLKSKYNNVIVDKQFICAEGDIPVALVAHMDTVFSYPAYDVYYDPRKNVLWSPDGLGADDRAGIFAILQIIKSGLRPHIIFTTDEEKGCIGADAMVKYECPFKELKYVIQLDRRGANDCVFYDCYNPDFIEFIEGFGFVEAYGTFSDISSICPAWKVCGVNLSVGYENEHSMQETLNIGHLYATIEKVKQILSLEEQPSFVYRKVKRNHFAYLYQPRAGQVHCPRCGGTFEEYDTFPVKGLNGKTLHYCIDCIDDSIGWCDICGEAYEIDMESPSLGCCHDCMGEYYKSCK